ncbi:MAG: hypothetical protein AAGC95_05185, partial [Pseudomonadota bacterium]
QNIEALPEPWVKKTISVGKLISKNLLEIGFSLGQIVLLAPLMAVLTVIMHLQGGTVYYKQSRGSSVGEFFAGKFRQKVKLNGKKDFESHINGVLTKIEYIDLDLEGANNKIDINEIFSNIQHNDYFVGPATLAPENLSDDDKTASTYLKAGFDETGEVNSAKKMGRPIVSGLPPGDRGKSVGLRVSTADYERIKNDADAKGISVSEWCRRYIQIDMPKPN